MEHKRTEIQSLATYNSVKSETEEVGTEAVSELQDAGWERTRQEEI